MKYLLMIYANQDTFAEFTPEQRDALIADTGAFQAKLKETGEWLVAYGVADQADCKSVTTTSGETVVTDGPYLEAKEYLGSIDIIDCAGYERAVEIAAQVPFARYGSVEIRPLFGGPDDQ